MSMNIVTHRYETRTKNGLLKRKPYYYDYNSDSDFDSDSNCETDSDSDSDYIESENDSDNESDVDDFIENHSNYKKKEKIKDIDKLKYYKFLNKLFPSNYSKNKINNLKRQRLFDKHEESNNFKFNFNKKLNKKIKKNLKNNHNKIYNKSNKSNIKSNKSNNKSNNK